jgi:hypothetical protein
VSAATDRYIFEAISRKECDAAVVVTDVDGGCRACLQCNRMGRLDDVRRLVVVAHGSGLLNVLQPELVGQHLLQDSELRYDVDVHRQHVVRLAFDASRLEHVPPNPVVLVAGEEGALPREHGKLVLGDLHGLQLEEDAMMRSFKARLIAVLSVALAGGLVVGAVVAAHNGPQVSADLESAIAGEPLVKALDLPDTEAGRRSVFLQPTSAGVFCVWDAPSATSKIRQGGCNSSDDPLGGRAVSASLAYDGGPGIEDVKDARLIGLVASEAASVHVDMSDGSQRVTKLKKAKVGSDEYLVFGYRFKRSDLKNGIGPTAVVALDSAGAEIGRQPTGIGN